MKKTLTLFTLLITIGFCNAQTNTVTGTITDCMGSPIAGHSVFIVTDSAATGGSPYYSIVTTNSLGVYSDNVPYNTFFGGVQPIYIYTTGFAPTYPDYSATENPSSAGNTFVNDFVTNCSTPPPPPLPNNFVEGTVLDCSGNPLAFHQVYVWVDSTFFGTSYHQITWTDASGYYFDSVPYGGGGLGEPLHIEVNDPYPGTTTYSVTEHPASSGNSYTNDFNTICGSGIPCAVYFYSYEDSTGFNDTTYLSLTVVSSTPSATTITWDFGDGTFATGASVTHVYAVNGTYNVCVTVFDASDSCTTTYCAPVEDIFRSGFVLKSVLSTPTFVIEKPELSSLIIYPNPVENSLIISAEDLVKVKSITVYDVTGRSQFTLNNTSVTNTLHMDTHTLTPGAYKMVLYDEFQNPLYTHTLLKH